MNHEEHGRRGFKWLMLAATMAAMALSFAAAYAVSSAVFRLTGRPREIWTYVITGLLGFIIFVSAVWVLTHIRGQGDLGKRRIAWMGQAIEAMNRIAHGDFSVFVPIEKDSPFSELAESVNKMARELGTMENLRQDFISNVSHEIQSPLTSISGFAALLRSRELNDEQRTHYIDVIEAEAKRLSKLSDNLLRLSSLENSTQPLSLASFSLDRQIQSTVLMLEPQWSNKNLELNLSLEKTAYTGDEGLLGQVWVNLIQNAVKFTPERGGIDITLMREENAVIFRVSDTGPGISEDDRMHIFERFYKADKARDRALGGNGLGLSIAKKIVEMHFGTIFVESELGAGSTFTVTLPNKK